MISSVESRAGVLNGLTDLKVYSMDSMRPAIIHSTTIPHSRATYILLNNTRKEIIKPIQQGKIKS